MICVQNKNFIIYKIIIIIIMVSFDEKIILITGGTGSIGENLVLKLLRDYSPKRVRIYSRDETKQFNLAKCLQEFDNKLRFFIGDIRDKDRLIRAMKDVDIVFHLAALKHVGACEYNPFEAIKSNILGLQNIIEVSMDCNIEKFIFVSTDKAATPCNTMGVTKLLGEKLVTTANYYKGAARTIFYSLRLGNVLGSRGSLIPLIEEQIINNLPITLTHREMTRYIMDMETAINFMLKTYDLAQGGEVFVYKMSSIKIIDMIDILIEHFAEKHNKLSEKIQINEIGMFAGEKLYEELFSIEESERTYELDDLYIIFPQLTEVSKRIDLNHYPHLKVFDPTNPFNSRDDIYLSKQELRDFLKNNEII